MKRALFLFASIALAAPALAQKMEPGEWLVTSTTTSPMLPKPEVESEKQCVKKEDVDDLDRWMGELAPDCKLTRGKKTADSYSWQVSCSKSGVRSSGSMRWTSTTVNADVEMVAPSGTAGEKVEMRTKISGKRLGPCKE